MNKRKLVTKPIMQKAIAATGGPSDDYQFTAKSAVEAAAPLIAEKAINDFADYFRETGLGIGMDPKIANSIYNIARRYARDYLQ